MSQIRVHLTIQEPREQLKFGMSIKKSGGRKFASMSMEINGKTIHGNADGIKCDVDGNMVECGLGGTVMMVFIYSNQMQAKEWSNHSA